MKNQLSVDSSFNENIDYQNYDSRTSSKVRSSKKNEMTPRDKLDSFRTKVTANPKNYQTVTHEYSLT